mgnify:CR=1 FL=1
MTLIKSISGIRGTIGGGAGEGLNPLDIVKFTSAYATLIRKTCKVKSNKIVVGRDARISGEMVKNVVVGTLMGMGWDVVDIDLASTQVSGRLAVEFFYMFHAQTLKQFRKNNTAYRIHTESVP